jgi:hypothetical protein
VTRYRRCGKPSCHCQKTKAHGPAHYLVVTVGRGKTESILLSEEMLPVARQFLDNYQRWRAAVEKVSEVNRRLLQMRVAELAGEKKGSAREGGKPQQRGGADE